MTDPNYGFSGTAPIGLTIENNVALAIAYQNTHSAEQTLIWFFDHVRNNSDGHLPWDQSMDYKQLGPEFEDFGNFNFGVVGKALGYPDWFLQHGAGSAQGVSDGLSYSEAILRSLLDFQNRGDNTGDQNDKWGRRQFSKNFQNH